MKKPLNTLLLTISLLCLGSCSKDDSKWPIDIETGVNGAHQNNKIKLSTIEIDNNVIYSDFLYDNKGNVICFVENENRFYKYEYKKDKIEIYQDAEKTVEFGLTNGKITSIQVFEGMWKLKGQYTYNNNNQIANVRMQREYGDQVEIQYLWNQGNIVKATCYKGENKEIANVYNIEYDNGEVYSGMELLAPLLHLNIYNVGINYIPFVDPILLSEGFYGNSCISNVPSYVSHKTGSYSEIGLCDYTVSYKWRFNNDSTPKNFTYVEDDEYNHHWSSITSFGWN